MAYGVVHFFPNGTKEQYDATLAVVHPDRSSLPKGQVFHAAGASADGWTVMAVHDTKESWEEFRDTVLMPRFEEGIPGGFKTMPQEQAFQTYNIQTQRSSEAEAREARQL